AWGRSMAAAGWGRGVAGGADARVVAGVAVERVIADPADDHVVERVAVAREGRGPGEHHVLDVVAERVADHARLDGVVAFVRRLDDRIVRAVDGVGVVAGAALHGGVRGAARRRVQWRAGPPGRSWPRTRELPPPPAVPLSVLAAAVPVRVGVVSATSCTAIVSVVVLDRPVWSVAVIVKATVCWAS